MGLLKPNFLPGTVKEKSYIRFLLLIFLVNVALSQNIVEYLPGYDGALPFKLETGYVNVDGVEIFYYFIESEGNPVEDPIFLWLSGGPGCSSLSTIVFEFGPLEFDIENYTGGLPQLKYYPYGWTKSSSVIFLDAPAGTGFSYSTTTEGWHSSHTLYANQSYQFLRKWMVQHPQYLSVQLFIGGDSYAGMIVPLVVQLIVKGNEEYSYPWLNLKGYHMGSPTTDETLNANAKIEFAHRMALISDELYEALNTSCNGSYVDVDPSNTACTTTMGKYEKNIEEIDVYDILEPTCASVSGRRISEHGRRSTKENTPNFILSPPKIPELWCRNFNYVLSYIWANNEQVQKALHVRRGMIKYWQRCNGSLSYTKDVQSVIEVHRYLSTKTMVVLVYNGDRDMTVTIVATQSWIKKLNLTLDYDWRPWLVDGQIAGYTYKYAEDGYFLTFASIKGAGHVAPEYRRKNCYEMFTRWIHYYPV